MTLLQAWIFEHFPEMGFRELTEGYNDELPRATRWTPSKGSGLMVPFRRQLDDLTTQVVSWMPYESHRAQRPFEDISLFSGYIRCGPVMHIHLPERVLRQFGNVQGIPRSPREVTSVPISPAEMDHMWLHYTAHVAPRGPRVAHPGECVNGYMGWFRMIFHRYLIPPSEGDPPRVPPTDPVSQPVTSSIPSHPFATSCGSCGRVTEIL